MGCLICFDSQVHPKASELLLSPNLVEMPGDCIALNGSSGFVDIRLRAKIFPTKVTLEHIHKSIAFEQSRYVYSSFITFLSEEPRQLK